MGTWILVLLCIILAASVVVLYHQKESLLMENSKEKSLEADKKYFYHILNEQAGVYVRMFEDLLEIKDSSSNVSVNCRDGIFTVNIATTYEKRHTKAKETRNLVFFYKICEKGKYLVEDTIPSECFSENYNFISHNIKCFEYNLGDKRGFLSHIDYDLFRASFVRSGELEGDHHKLCYLGGFNLVIPYSLKELTESVDLAKMSLKCSVDSSKDSISKLNKCISKTADDIDDIDISIAISEFMENSDEIVNLLEKSKSEKELSSIYIPFIKSCGEISNLLTEFWTLKKQNKLSEREENNIQDRIEVEVLKCSKLAKMEEI